MGSSRTTSTNTTRERTEDQKRLDELDLQLREQGQAGLGELQDLGQRLSASILRGEAGPGAFGTQLFGLSEDQISDISQKAVSDIRPGIQRSGILDSGIARQLEATTAADVRRGAAEYNVGAAQNALNLAFGGQAQVQQPGLSRSSALGSRLAQFGTTSSMQRMRFNPFQESFAQSAGSGLGNLFNPQTFIKPR